MSKESLEAILRSIDTSLAQYLRKDEAVLDVIPDGEEFARVRREVVENGFVTSLYLAGMGALIPADALVWLGMFGNGLDGDYSGGSLDPSRGVWEFSRFELPSGQQLTVPPLTIIRCLGDVIIDGTILVSTWGTAMVGSGQPGWGMNGGRSGVFFEGGGGGGNGGAGGSGGSSSYTTVRASGGPAAPLGFFFPGGGGGSGAGGIVGANETCFPGSGGPGGGALMIVARGEIIVRGSIVANGGNGSNANTIGGSAMAAGGGGGGAGGSVFLRSAQRVIISGSISANGGRGGSGVSQVSYESAGGGGGGGGGWVHIVSPRVESLGTISVSGGAGVMDGLAGESGKVVVEVRDIFPFFSEVVRVR